MWEGLLRVHYCINMAYALNYLVLFIALFMALLNIWNHKCTRVAIIHKKTEENVIWWHGCRCNGKYWLLENWGHLGHLSHWLVMVKVTRIDTWTSCQTISWSYFTLCTVELLVLYITLMYMLGFLCICLNKRWVQTENSGLFWSEAVLLG